MRTNHNSFLLTMVIALLVATSVSASDQLNTILEQGKTAFVIVTGPEATGLPQVQKAVQQAIDRVGNAEVIEVDRSDSQNSELVNKYELATAPVPLVLAFSPNGALGGGVPGTQATAEKLVTLVPSPKKADALKALQDGKAVYVTASRAGMSSKPEVASGCAAACREMKGTCIAIDIDMDDPAEQAFLKLLNVDMQSADPITVVVNAQGQVTGSFNGTVDVSQLVQAANKKVTSGCCPPGSGKTCGPTTKKKGD
jgi:Mrp family chromosome partitioning ATPase